MPSENKEAIIGKKTNLRKYKELKIEKNKFKEANLKVGLIAPSYWVSKKSRNVAIARLKHLGINKVDGFKDLFKKKYFWGGEPIQRAEVINDFFKDDTVNIIWALRGGFASISVIEHLDFEAIREHKKLFIGYSDITILQLAMRAKADLPSIQFYMPGTANWLRTKRDASYLSAILSGSRYSAKITTKQIKQKGYASAEITGGCLDLICSTIGTDFEIDTKEKILFLEDANIPPDRFYNLLYILKLANKLDDIKGLIIGKIFNCKNYKEYLSLFLKDIKQTANYPIITEFNSGHTIIKVPIPLGGNCTINTDAQQVTFSFPEEFKTLCPLQKKKKRKSSRKTTRHVKKQRNKNN